MSHIGGEHRVIVIGDHAEVVNLRNMGIDVLGSVSGPINSSNTLTRRLHNLINKVYGKATMQIVSWGWHATTLVSNLNLDGSIVGIVDEIDLSGSIGINKMKIVPTNWNCSKRLSELGVFESSISEPLVGVVPTVLSVDKRSARELLNIEQNSFVISIVGNQSSWQEILSMMFRLNTIDRQIDFVIPESYKYRPQLLMSVESYGLVDNVHGVHRSLRTVDVVRASNCVWVPDTAPFDVSYGVLDTVTVACEDVPLTVSVNHPVSSTPMIGHLIAWSRDELDSSSWIIDLVNDSKNSKKESKNQSLKVRSYASPTRFVDGLLMRL
ncbi:MAG: hypothetical protein QF718_01565 [Phycisphaerales bacterium]|jgi:hypothetical protein|nr:hypothetical protein [Phycisphaerales bacterium]